MAAAATEVASAPAEPGITASRFRDTRFDFSIATIEFRITAIERRDSGWRRGAVIGLFAVPLAVYVAVSQDDVEGWAPLFAAISAPFGALGGGLVGALGSTWVPVWERPLAEGGQSR